MLSGAPYNAPRSQEVVEGPEGVERVASACMGTSRWFLAAARRSSYSAVGHANCEGAACTEGASSTAGWDNLCGGERCGQPSPRGGTPGKGEVVIRNLDHG